ncbi:MAG TPA: FAD binding domain-containing protein [Stellaceae bacterium]|jgi:carbon-monoxide dehydrogenase medium subunit|nr:FAD binding domain-containing protein [Stellaceae bacterium]
MKAAAFDYARPHDVGEALGLLAQAKGDAKVLAGGQSLGPMLNLRLARPGLLIDISRLDELRGIEDAGDAWRIGAAVTHSEIEDAHGALRGGEMLVEVAAGIAYRAVRNRGTIGGSLAHADPAGDWPLALAALGADVVLRGPAGERSVPAATVITAAFTTEVRDDEIITAVVVPKLSGAARFGYFKFCRKTGEFPEASSAVAIDLEQDAARVYLGALSGPPQPLPELARRIAEGGHAAVTRAAAAEAVAAIASLDPIERRMHAGALLRALERAFAA